MELRIVMYSISPGCPNQKIKLFPLECEMWITVYIPLLQLLHIQLHSLLFNYQAGAQIKKYKKGSCDSPLVHYLCKKI